MPEETRQQEYVAVSIALGGASVHQSTPSAQISLGMISKHDIRSQIRSLLNNKIGSTTLLQNILGLIMELLS
jgi:hypothetical protein